MIIEQNNTLIKAFKYANDIPVDVIVHLDLKNNYFIVWPNLSLEKIVIDFTLEKSLFS